MKKDLESSPKLSSEHSIEETKKEINVKSYPGMGLLLSKDFPIYKKDPKCPFAIFFISISYLLVSSSAFKFTDPNFPLLVFFI